MQKGVQGEARVIAWIAHTLAQKSVVALISLTGAHSHTHRTCNPFTMLFAPFPLPRQSLSPHQLRACLHGWETSNDLGLVFLSYISID